MPILELNLPADPSRKNIEYRINSNDCWICTSHAKRGFEYPAIRVLGKATTIARTILNAPNDKCALHKCDEKACINPEHLYLGTNYENIRDRVNRGRNAVGVKHGKSKLSEKDILKIRKLKEIGWSHRKIAKIIGVEHSTIGIICRRETWSHI